ncbi:MAG: amino acid ABC transporter permease [Ardenticatenaceae bacterium]
MSESASLAERRGPQLAPALDRVAQWPWWLLVAIALGLFVALSILTDAQMTVIFRAVAQGLRITIGVTIAGYSLALLIGLLVGLGRVSQNRLVYNVASFYVEVVRGIPMLVLLLYIAFVVVPLVVGALNSLGSWLLSSGMGFGEFLAELSTRDLSFILRVVIGLGIGYGAFEAEVFRAGIESIPKGQMEAARSLGMTHYHAMRYIILPQAVRNVMPALGNDFVAMLKDSALVSVLGVRDITQIAKLYAASTFLFFQTYNILVFLYLVMTILLTRLVRYMERRLGGGRR